LVLHAQAEVIDFSFYVTEPAYAWAACQFLVNGYAVPGIPVLSPTESKRAIVEAHAALFAAADRYDSTGSIVSASPQRNRGNADCGGRRRFDRLIRCLCHLIRSLRAGSIEAEMVSPVLWAYTRQEVARQQRKAVFMLHLPKGKLDE
jgi:hypothetical protein